MSGNRPGNRPRHFEKKNLTGEPHAEKKTKDFQTEHLRQQSNSCQPRLVVLHRLNKQHFPQFHFPNASRLSNHRNRKQDISQEDVRSGTCSKFALLREICVLLSKTPQRHTLSLLNDARRISQHCCGNRWDSQCAARILPCDNHITYALKRLVPQPTSRNKSSCTSSFFPCRTARWSPSFPTNPEGKKNPAMSPHSHSSDCLLPVLCPVSTTMPKQELLSFPICSFKGCTGLAVTK